MSKFIKISYTGRIKDGRIFDTTDEKIAQEEDIYDEKKVYGPIPLITGEKQIIDGLDSVLQEMQVGEEKTTEIPPEKAYGVRNPELVRLIPMRAFKKQKITPIPGMPVELDGKLARIQTVTGGRVRVDFNPELAGKTVVYDIKVEETAETNEDKIKYLLERTFNSIEGVEFELTDKNLRVTIPENLLKDNALGVKKAFLTTEIFKYLDVESTTFEEIWKKEE